MREEAQHFDSGRLAPYMDHLVDWCTAHSGTFDRNSLTFALIDGLGWGAFALRDLQVRSLHGISYFFFSSSLLLETRSTRPALALARSHTLHPTPSSRFVDAYRLSSLSDR